MHITGGGEIVSVKWQREKYLPKIQEKYDREMTELLKDKPISCDV